MFPQADGKKRGSTTSDDSDAEGSHSSGSHGTPDATQENPRKLAKCEEVAGTLGSSSSRTVRDIFGISDIARAMWKGFVVVVTCI